MISSLVHFRMASWPSIENFVHGYLQCMHSDVLHNWNIECRREHLPEVHIAVACADQELLLFSEVLGYQRCQPWEWQSVRGLWAWYQIHACSLIGGRITCVVRQRIRSMYHQVIWWESLTWFMQAGCFAPLLDRGHCRASDLARMLMVAHKILAACASCGLKYSATILDECINYPGLS